MRVVCVATACRAASSRSACDRLRALFLPQGWRDQRDVEALTVLAVPVVDQPLAGRDLRVETNGELPLNSILQARICRADAAAVSDRPRRASVCRPRQRPRNERRHNPDRQCAEWYRRRRAARRRPLRRSAAARAPQAEPRHARIPASMQPYRQARRPCTTRRNRRRPWS